MDSGMGENSEWEAMDEGRDRGILTSSDREFLSGTNELTDQSARDARYRIRNRVKNSIRDIAFLDRFLEKKDRKPVAEAVFQNDNYSSANSSRVFSFPFRMLIDVEDDIEEGKSRLETALTTALRTVTRDYLGNPEDYIVNVSVNISISYHKPDMEEIKEKYKNYNESYDELTFLMEKNEVSMDETFYRHVLLHSWEDDRGFAIPGQDEGMMVFDSSDFEDKEGYIQEVLTALREEGFLEMD